MSLRATKHVHGLVTCQPLRCRLLAIYRLVGFGQFTGVKGGLVVLDGGKIAVLRSLPLRQPNQLHVLKLCWLTAKDVAGNLLCFGLSSVLLVCVQVWRYLVAIQSCSGFFLVNTLPALLLCRPIAKLPIGRIFGHINKIANKNLSWVFSVNKFFNTVFNSFQHLSIVGSNRAIFYGFAFYLIVHRISQCALNSPSQNLTGIRIGV